MQHKVLIVGGSGFIGHNLSCVFKKEKVQSYCFR